MGCHQAGSSALTLAEVAAGVEMVMGLVAVVQGLGDREAAGCACRAKTNQQSDGSVV
jgi:hypothetical protein